MNIIGKFKALDTFNILGRGIVIRGELIEGNVKINSKIKLFVDDEFYLSTVAGVDYIDNISKGESWVGLTFFTDKKLEIALKKNKLKEQVVEIFE